MSYLIHKILQERFMNNEDTNENTESYAVYEKVAANATKRAKESDHVDDHIRAEFAHLKAAHAAPSHDVAKDHITQALSHFRDIHN